MMQLTLHLIRYQPRLEVIHGINNSSHYHVLSAFGHVQLRCHTQCPSLCHQIGSASNRVIPFTHGLRSTVI